MENKFNENNLSKDKKDNIVDKYNVESSSVNDLDGCAATEMTGLIPSPPESEAELESYKRLYPFSPDEYVK